MTILENSIKITNEPPKGLRPNLLKNFINDPIADSNFFNSCSLNENKWKKLLFSLCFFHVVVEERKKFGPLGWNIPYEFNEADLHLSMRQLKFYMESYETVQFDALTYLTGECIYGGRVTDIQDRRLINSLLNIFYCEAIIQNDNYKYFNLEMYHVPKENTYDGYINYIYTLPINTPPEAFGLNSNAELTRNYHETQQLFDAVLLTLPRDNPIRNSNQDIIDEIIKDILKKLPQEFDIKSIQVR